jgi:hypothetical protein
MLLNYEQTAPRRDLVARQRILNAQTPVKRKQTPKPQTQSSDHEIRSTGPGGKAPIIADAPCRPSLF